MGVVYIGVVGWDKVIVCGFVVSDIGECGKWVGCNVVLFGRCSGR